ncbi:hypothetical protein J7K25_00845 [bacterium]|nr:hypothetical protein [bacterium]
MRQLKEIIWCSKYGIKCQEFSTCEEYFTTGGCEYQRRIQIFENEKTPRNDIKWNAYTGYFRVEG